MKNEQNKITDELLVKYLLGEASDTEIQQAQLWLNNSSSNQKHYDELTLLWDNSKAVTAGSTVNTSEAWDKFKKRTQHKTISIAPKNYYGLKIAALVLLLAGAGTVFFLTRDKYPVAKETAQTYPSETKTIASSNKPKIIKNEPVIEESKKIAPLENKIASLENKPVAISEVPIQKIKTNVYRRPLASADSYRGRKQMRDELTKTKGIICNGTPCPIEICITQTIKCHGQPSVVSSCSTLEPDQSGKLHYKTHDKIGKHCTMSVDEITIKTVSTGETIVLDAHSKPATAQDFFNYIKKGGVIASAFQSDCNDNRDCGYKFNNNFGDLIIQ